MDDSTPLKRCPACEQEFPATTDHFFEVTTGSGKLRARCKPCYSQWNTAYMQKWRLKNADHHREYQRQYRTKNKERINAQMQFYREIHPGRAAAYSRKWAARHREKTREQARINGHRRRALKNSTDGSYTAKYIHEQHHRQKGKCYWCAKKLDEYHIDHVVPISRGGTNDPSNIVLACPTCNLRKWNKLPHEWPEGGRLM